MNETPKKKSKWRWVFWAFVSLGALMIGLPVAGFLFVFIGSQIAPVEAPRMHYNLARFGPSDQIITFDFCPKTDERNRCWIASYNLETKEAHRFEFEPMRTPPWSEMVHSWDGRMAVLKTYGPYGNHIALLDMRAMTYRVIRGIPRVRASFAFSPDGGHVYYYASLTEQERGIVAGSKSDAKGRALDRNFFSIFRTDIKTGKEERWSQAEGGGAHGLNASRLGLHHGSWIDEGAPHLTPVFTPFANVDKPVFYRAKDDPFFNKHEALFSSSIHSSWYFKAVTRDGSVLSSLADNKMSDGPCANLSTFQYNLFMTVPGRGTHRVTRFDCTSLGRSIDIAPSGKRILVETAPGYPATEHLRAAMLFITSEEELEKRAKEESHLFIMNTDGSGLSYIDLPKSINAYKPVKFQRAQKQ